MTPDGLDVVGPLDMPAIRASLPPEECEPEIAYPVYVQCGMCEGKGRWQNPIADVTCPECHGTGNIEVRD